MCVHGCMITWRTCPSLQAINPLEGSLCHCFDPQTGQRIPSRECDCHTHSHVSSASAPQVASSTPYFVLSTTDEILTFSRLACVAGNHRLSVIVFHISIYMIVFTDFCWVYRWTKARNECRTWYAGADIFIQEDYEIFDLVSEVEASEGRWRIFRSIVRYFSRFSDGLNRQRDDVLLMARCSVHCHVERNFKSVSKDEYSDAVSSDRIFLHGCQHVLLW